MAFSFIPLFSESPMRNVPKMVCSCLIYLFLFIKLIYFIKKNRFKHLDTLKDHIRRHYAATETCKYCGRVSSNKKSLRLHIRNVHADIDSSVKTRNEFPCSVCGKIFKKKQTLRVSVRLSIQMTFK